MVIQAILDRGTLEPFCCTCAGRLVFCTRIVTIDSLSLQGLLIPQLHQSLTVSAICNNAYSLHLLPTHIWTLADITSDECQQGLHTSSNLYSNYLDPLYSHLIDVCNSYGFGMSYPNGAPSKNNYKPPVLPPNVTLQDEELLKLDSPRSCSLENSWIGLYRSQNLTRPAFIILAAQ